MPDNRATLSGHIEDGEDPQYVLAGIRSGAFGDDIGEALLFFNRNYYPKAIRSIAKYLTDSDAYTRGLALQVLTKYQASRYIGAARTFLEHDPDVTNQVNGADALGFMLRNTGNRKMLKVLAAIVMNETKLQSVRASAYKAMQKIIHYDIREERARMATFTFPDDVDWALVRKYR